MEDYRNDTRPVYLIYPVGDSKRHKLYSKKCKCNPTIEEHEDHVLISHHSFDGREGLELANRVLDERKPFE